MDLVKPDSPHRREVVFVVDRALFFVERRDRRHFFGTECEVENKGLSSIRGDNAFVSGTQPRFP